MRDNQFYVEAYHAWLPGIDEQQNDWEGFFQQRWQPSAKKADVGFLPAMQRRRLSALARAVAHVLHYCSAEQGSIIFCTRYGEVERTDSILRDIARQQEVSPTSFGLSVFNAIAGQISILQNSTAAMSTLVPPEDEYLLAFVDALGYLQQGTESITIVFYEEPLSEVLKPYCYLLPCTMALAVKISAQATSSNNRVLELSFDSTTRPTYEKGSGILELMRFFTLQESQVQIGQWQIAER